jgi:hypothetical protein
VETNRQSEVLGAIPQRIVVRMIVVFVDGAAGHHHADQAHLFGATKILDRAVDAQDRSLRQSENPIRRLAAHRLQPSIVGLHTRIFVFGIAMHAESHPDRGVDDLGRDSIFVHEGKAGLATVCSLAHIRELKPFGAVVAFLDAEAGAVDEAERDRPLHPGHHEGLGAVGLLDDTRCVVAILGLDVVHVAVRRFAYVTVRRNDAPRNHVHDLLSRCSCVHLAASGMTPRTSRHLRFWFSKLPAHPAISGNLVSASRRKR